MKYYRSKYTPEITWRVHENGKVESMCVAMGIGDDIWAMGSTGWQESSGIPDWDDIEEIAKGDL